MKVHPAFQVTTTPLTTINVGEFRVTTKNFGADCRSCGNEIRSRTNSTGLCQACWRIRMKMNMNRRIEASIAREAWKQQ